MQTKYENTDQLISTINVILLKIREFEAKVTIEIQAHLQEENLRTQTEKSEYLALRLMCTKLEQQKHFIQQHSTDHYTATILTKLNGKNLTDFLTTLEDEIVLATSNEMTKREKTRTTIVLLYNALQYLLFFAFLAGIVCLVINTSAAISLPLFLAGLWGGIFLGCTASFVPSQDKLPPNLSEGRCFTESITVHDNTIVLKGNSSALKGLFFQRDTDNPYGVEAIQKVTHAFNR